MKLHVLAIAALAVIGLAGCATENASDDYFARLETGSPAGPPHPGVEYYDMVNGQWAKITPQGAYPAPLPPRYPSYRAPDVSLSIYQPTVCPGGLGGLLFGPPICNYNRLYGYSSGMQFYMGFPLGGRVREWKPQSRNHR